MRGNLLRQFLLQAALGVDGGEFLVFVFDVWGNNANGIHMNGDAEQSGDGVISGAVVERNIILTMRERRKLFARWGGAPDEFEAMIDSLRRAAA